MFVKKKIMIGIIAFICFIAIIFWIVFAIVAYRNEYYVFEYKNNSKSDMFLCLDNNNVKYYSYGLSDIFVYEQRFIFKINKKSLKNIIEDDELETILSNFYLFKNNTGNGIEYIYTSKDETFSVIRCELNDREKFYILSQYSYLNRCKLVNP